MTAPTLQDGDDLAASVAKTPARVTLDDIMAKVRTIEYLHPELAPHVTIACVQMRNGFVLIGKSAPADPANFDAKAGKQFAVDDALKQAWAFEGYLLRETLAGKEEFQFQENAVRIRITLEDAIESAVATYLDMLESGEVKRKPHDAPAIITATVRAKLAGLDRDWEPDDLHARCAAALMRALLAER